MVLNGTGGNAGSFATMALRLSGGDGDAPVDRRDPHRRAQGGAGPTRACNERRVAGRAMHDGRGRPAEARSASAEWVTRQPAAATQDVGVPSQSHGIWTLATATSGALSVTGTGNGGNLVLNGVVRAGRRQGRHPVDHRLDDLRVDQREHHAASHCTRGIHRDFNKGFNPASTEQHQRQHHAALSDSHATSIGLPRRRPAAPSSLQPEHCRPRHHASAEPTAGTDARR